MEYLFILVFLIDLLLNTTETAPVKRALNISKSTRLPRPTLMRAQRNSSLSAEARRWFLFPTKAVHRATPKGIWVDSYYIEDFDYPLLKARQPIPKEAVGIGANIAANQMIPLLTQLVIGGKETAKKRGFIPAMGFEY